MAGACPGSGIIGAKYINSKIIVWKRTWAHLSNMVNSTGFGWNLSAVNPEITNMHYKSYPLFHMWGDMFGKDRATGAGAIGYDDEASSVFADNTTDFNPFEDVPEVSMSME